MVEKFGTAQQQQEVRKAQSVSVKKSKNKKKKKRAIRNLKQEGPVNEVL